MRFALLASRIIEGNRNTRTTTELTFSGCCNCVFIKNICFCKKSKENGITWCWLFINDDENVKFWLPTGQRADLERWSIGQDKLCEKPFVCVCLYNFLKSIYSLVFVYGRAMSSIHSILLYAYCFIFQMDVCVCV